MNEASARERAALRLIEAAESGVPCDPILDLLPYGTVDDAYDVQQQVIAMTRNGGGIGARRVGRKIGLTSRAMQQSSQIGDTEPAFRVVGEVNKHVVVRHREPRIALQLALQRRGQLNVEPHPASPQMLFVRGQPRHLRLHGPHHSRNT